MLVPEGDQALELVEEVVVPGVGLVPGEGAAVVGVVAAGEADLVAVVDRRGAGEGHLEEGRQAERRGVAPGEVEEAGDVVAPQQVHHHGGRVRVVVREELLDVARNATAPVSSIARKLVRAISPTSTLSPMKKA